MDRLLAYGLWILLSPPSASAIWCFKCERKCPDEVCRGSPEFCWAGETEACYSQNLYMGNSCIISDVGCIPNCKAEYRPSDGFLWRETLCCYRNYCNR